MTIKDLADKVGVSTATVNKWLKEQKIKGEKSYPPGLVKGRWVLGNDALEAAKELKAQFKNGGVRPDPSYKLK
ncbi:MAG TPA: MerR family transcriptional regulator [Pyrinomonadaceae bacterium]|nr:MerR family transcriptional regulator [Pyrinomonadaceae bacterium]